MPATVAASAALGAVIGGSVGVGFTIAGSAALAGALLYGGIAAASYIVNRALAPDAPKLAAADSKAIRTMFRASATAAKWILGTARMGGWIFAMQEGDDQDERGYRSLGFGVALSEGGFDELTQVWINGERQGFRRVKTIAADGSMTFYRRGEDAPADAIRVPVAEDSEFSVTGQTGDEDRIQYQRWMIVPRSGTGGWGAFEQLKSYEGADLFGFDNAPKERFDSDGTTLIGYENEAWNVGWVWVRLWQPNFKFNDDQPVWPGQPTIEFVVRGMRTDWPAAVSGATKVAKQWTQNAAVWIRWFLIERMDVPESAIDQADFRAAYDKSHETLFAPVTADTPATWGGAYLRYTINTVVSSTDNASKVLADMVWQTQGALVDLDGKIHIHAGADRPAVKTLDSNAIIAVEEARPTPAYTDRLNAVTLRLAQSAAHRYGEFELPEVTDTEAQERDGRRLAADLGTLAMEVHPARAQMKARIALRKARAQSGMVYRVIPGTNWEWLTTAPGERIQVTDPEYGLVNEKMEVLSNRVVSNRMEVVLNLIEAPDGIFADDPVSMPPLVNTTVFPPPHKRPPVVTGLTATAQAGFAGGSIRSLVNIRWHGNGRPVAIVITGPGGYSERTISIDEENGHTFYPGRPGIYNILARHVGHNGLESRVAARAQATVDWEHLRPPVVSDLTAAPFAILDEATVQILEIGTVISWGESAHDTIVTLSGQGFAEERAFEPGTSSTRFVVERTGNYTVRAHTVNRPTGLASEAVEVLVNIGTSDLTPYRLAVGEVVEEVTVTASGDGAPISLVDLSWPAHAHDRARVSLVGPGGYSERQDVRERTARFSVPREGKYTWRIQLYNGAETGVQIQSDVDVSWAGLAPTERIRVVSFEPRRGFLHLVLRRPSDLDIDGFEIRFHSHGVNAPGALARIDTEEDWSNATPLGEFPMTIGPLGNLIIPPDIALPDSGEYRMSARWSNRLGQLGPISYLGQGLFVLPAEPHGRVEVTGNWEGTLSRMGALADEEHGNVLVFDPGLVVNLPVWPRSGAFWNGGWGWPHGGAPLWETEWPRDEAVVDNRTPSIGAPATIRYTWRVGGTGGLTDRAGVPRLLGQPSDPNSPVELLHASVFILARRANTNANTNVMEPHVGALSLRLGGISDRQADGTYRTGRRDNLIDVVENGTDATWELIYERPGRPDVTQPITAPHQTGNNRIDVGGDEPYLGWEPPISHQTGLLFFIQTVATSSEPGTVKLRVRQGVRPNYVLPIGDAGEVSSWILRLTTTVVTPPGYQPNEAPTPGAPVRVTFQTSTGLTATGALAAPITTVTPEVADLGGAAPLRETRYSRLVTNARYFRVEVEPGYGWDGVGFTEMVMDWLELT